MNYARNTDTIKYNISKVPLHSIPRSGVEHRRGKNWQDAVLGLRKRNNQSPVDIRRLVISLLVFCRVFLKGCFFSHWTAMLCDSYGVANSVDGERKYI